MRVLPAIILLAMPLSSQDRALLKHFDYDQKSPLDYQAHGAERRENVGVYDVSYASPKGGAVPAYLVVPVGKGPFAAIIWAHWHQDGSEFRNRKEFLEEAIALAPSGVISLLIDSPIARPGHVMPSGPLDDLEAEQRVQQILDVRRGADVLLGRVDVDPKRLAYVGHSYNAQTGAFIAGIDRRFKAFVLMAGILSDEVTTKSKEFEEYRQQVGPEKMDAFMQKYAWLDPGKFVSHAAPAAVFMQFASEEDFLTPALARQYAAIVSEPKQIKIYDAPHALNAEARRDRIAFLVKEMKLKDPDPEAIVRVPILVQPTPAK